MLADSPLKMADQVDMLANAAIHFAQQLRHDAIGDLAWNASQHVFAYSDRSPKVAAVLGPANYTRVANC